MSYLNLRLYQRNTQCLHIRKHRLAGFFVRLVVACAFAAQAPLSSADLYFNLRFLADDPQAVADLSRFENGQELPPGTYRVDIYLNMVIWQRVMSHLIRATVNKGLFPA